MIMKKFFLSTIKLSLYHHLSPRSCMDSAALCTECTYSTPQINAPSVAGAVGSVGELLGDLPTATPSCADSHPVSCTAPNPVYACRT